MYVFNQSNLNNNPKTPIDLFIQGIRSKHPKTKMSQVICQNVPFLVSQYVPSIFSLYLIKLEIAKIF